MTTLDFSVATIDVTAVPESSSLLALAFEGGLAAFHRRKRKSQSIER